MKVFLNIVGIIDLLILAFFGKAIWGAAQAIIYCRGYNPNFPNNYYCTDYTSAPITLIMSAPFIIVGMVYLVYLIKLLVISIKR